MIVVKTEAVNNLSESKMYLFSTNGNFLGKTHFELGIRRIPVDDLDNQIHVMISASDAGDHVETEVVDILEVRRRAVGYL